MLSETRILNRDYIELPQELLHEISLWLRYFYTGPDGVAQYLRTSPQASVHLHALPEIWTKDSSEVPTYFRE